VAIPRENTWTSACLVDNLNFFGGPDVQGPYRLLGCFVQTETHRRLHFRQLAMMVSAFARTSIMLSRPFAVEWVPRLAELVDPLLLEMEEDELRSLTKDGVDATLLGLEALLRRVAGRAAAARHREEMTLRVAERFLRSPFFTRRLDGLKLLVQCIRMVEDAARYPSGLRIKPPEGGAGEGAAIGEYQVVEVARYLTAEGLACWLEQRLLVETLYDPKTWHSELIERSGEVVAFLAQQSHLPDATLEAIWGATHPEVPSQMEKPACAVLIGLCANLQYPQLQLLLGSLRALPAERFKAESFEMAKALCLRCVDLAVLFRSVVKREGGGTGQEHAEVVERILGEGLNLLWVASQAQCGLGPELSSHAVEMLKVVVTMGAPSALLMAGVASAQDPQDVEEAWALHRTRLDSLVQSCVTNLRGNESVEAALVVLRAILLSFPQAPSSRSGQEDGAAEGAAEMDMGTFQCSTVIAWLQASTNFLDLILANAILLHTQHQEAMAVGVGGEARTPAPGFLEGLSKRLEALACLFSTASMSLSQEQLALMWRHLNLEATCGEERDLFMTWLLSSVVTLQPQTEHMLEESVTLWLFEECMSSEAYLASPAFTDSALSCLLRLFLKINVAEGTIVRTSPPSSTVSTAAMPNSFQVRIQTPPCLGLPILRFGFLARVRSGGSLMTLKVAILESSVLVADYPMFHLRCGCCGWPMTPTPTPVRPARR
jgi:hypothetical protein